MADGTRHKTRKLPTESTAAGRVPALTVASLHESQERLALAMEAGGMFAWECDLDTGKIILSEHAEPMLGLEPGTFGGTWAEFLALVHPVDRAAVQQEIERASHQDAPFESEFRTVRPAGRVRWGLMRGRVYRDAQGRAVRLAGVDVDITARKLAEADTLFLAQLSERIRRDGEAATLTREVTRAVGEYLQVQRCFFTEVDLARDQFVIHQDYCDGVPTITSTYTLSDFNPALVALTSSGKVLVVRDANDDSRAGEFEAYAQLGLRAFVVVPLLREGRMTASFVIATASARDWQPRDVSLLETIAELTWQVLERLRSEEAVRSSEMRLRTIINSEPECVKLLDAQGCLLEMNPAGLAMIEADSLAQVAGKPVARIINKEYRRAFAALTRRVFAGETGDLEFQITGLKGTSRWLQTHAVPLRDAQGQIIAVLGLTRDITWRKTADRALQESQARTAGIIGSAMDAIVSVDETQRIRLFNPAAEQMFGYAAEEVMGQSLELLLPERARSAHAEHIRKFGATKTTKRMMGALGAISGVRKSGEEFPIEASISQVEVQGQKLYTVILRDITRRRAAETRLQEQAALLNQAREAIISCDLNGHICFWNHGAELIYGWAVEEVMGQDLRELVHCHQPPAITADSEGAKAILEKGEWLGELKHFTKVGREIVVDCHVSLVRDEQGQPASFLIINTDITEQKHLEAQFLRAQRLESIGTLASGIAHDLNNVLSPLLMAVQLLQSRLRDQSSQRLLDILQQNVQRGSDMIKQVLAFARGTSGERISLQPRHLIKDVIAILQETFPKDVTIKYRLPGDLAAVSGDPTQLHQVLMNLCVNARDAMAEHGGTLTITAENKGVDAQMAGMIPGAQAGNYLVITIADSGTGIAPDVLEKVFDPFFTTKEIGRGTGLGLSTVHSIIKSHGGFVNVYSEVGRGTRFHLYLPVLETRQPVPVTTPAETLPHGHGEWVLVVDDEQAIRAVTQSTLEAYGYRVLTAADGTEAIALYAQHKDQIQMVVTDMMMPYLDGPATIRALRNINPAVAIIASSGLSESEKAQEAEALGVQAFLTKPYSAADLLQTLATALNSNTNNFTSSWHEQA